MFEISEQLILEQLGEIFWVPQISCESFPWKQSSLVNDEEVISLSCAKVHVFSDFVLCLEKMHQNQSNTAWEDKVCFMSTSTLQHACRCPSVLFGDCAHSTGCTRQVSGGRVETPSPLSSPHPHPSPAYPSDAHLQHTTTRPVGPPPQRARTPARTPGGPLHGRNHTTRPPWGQPRQHRSSPPDTPRTTAPRQFGNPLCYTMHPSPPAPREHVFQTCTLPVPVTAQLANLTGPPPATSSEECATGQTQCVTGQTYPRPTPPRLHQVLVMGAPRHRRAQATEWMTQLTPENRMHTILEPNAPRGPLSSPRHTSRGPLLGGNTHTPPRGLLASMPRHIFPITNCPSDASGRSRLPRLS